MPNAAVNRQTGRPKTLVFHIGDHKTGSTSIQYAFAADRVALENRSVLYPARINSNRLRPESPRRLCANRRDSNLSLPARG
mgnify:CR=1 FL=1